RPRLGTSSSTQAFQLRDLVMMTQADLSRVFRNQTLGFESVDVILGNAQAANMARTGDAIRRMVSGYAQVRQRGPAVAMVGSAIAAATAGVPGVALADVAEPQLPNIEVETADEKLRQLDNNMRLYRLISRTVSVVALLTASYIIFTTLGMGMVQRQVELGMLRSVGAGRLQIALATFAEAVPIAVVGILIGLLSGVAATKAVIYHYRGFFTRTVISYDGLLWAAFGGFVAVMLAVALPAWMASRVSPLAASRPQGRRMPLRLDVILGLAGIALLGLSFLTRYRLWPGAGPDQVMDVYLGAGVPMIYLGYFLAAPLVVATLGRVLKYVAALLAWVRPRLLDDQMQTARWRTAATFCALMVGISMLVNLRVHSESIISGWQLPTKIPPGFVFFFEELNRDQLRRVTALPQVRTPTPLMAFWVRCLPPEQTDRSSSREVKFLAGPIGDMSQLIQLNFVEIQGGRPSSWALAQVDVGRGVLVTREFATRYGVKLGDPVRLYREHTDPIVALPIVGVVESSTLDMAIDFLNLRDRFLSLSAGTIIGNIANANRILLAERVATTRAAGNQPADGGAELPLLTRILLFDFPRKPDGSVVDSQASLKAISGELEHMGVRHFPGSLDELLEMIIGEYRGVVAVLAKIALWAMAIASLGVGFSMAANVQSRRRQLAVLRAIGMTRFQLARQVLAEAVTIALLGSVLGIVHGVHVSLNALYFDRMLFGLQSELKLPAGALGLAIGFAVICCLVASLIPALRAGRTNILAAMRQL
ncbi:MAG: ABC transporter permease, partial [Phycisphaerae bacterium]|nr:ABC transporter permease [Phycisphaerae bacterium]